MAALTDEQLMEAWLDGDESAFNALFERHAPRLQAIFQRSVGSRAAAQDLVQQTFLHVHRARRDFRRGSRVKPWLYAIAMNNRRQHFRRASRKPEAPLSDATPPSVGPEATTPEARAVRRALDELTEDQREVVLLHWYEGFSFPEIGELVGASTSAVKVRAFRAYERLRAVLGDGNRRD